MSRFDSLTVKQKLTVIVTVFVVFFIAFGLAAHNTITEVVGIASQGNAGVHARIMAAIGVQTTAERGHHGSERPGRLPIRESDHRHGLPRARSERPRSSMFAHDLFR